MKGKAIVKQYNTKELFESENLEDAIMAFNDLEGHLMNVLKKTNYEGKGAEDAEELKKHFDTAIAAMMMQLPEIKEAGMIASQVMATGILQSAT